MSAAGFYLGTWFSGADAKSRFTLPPMLRNRVKAGSGANQLYCRLPATAPYLIGFGADHVAELEAKIVAKLEAAEAAGEDFEELEELANAASSVEQFTFDDGGRFSLPDDLKARLGITDCLFFRGAFRAFEIWAPTRFVDSASGDQLQRDRCQAHLSEWMASPKNPKNGGKP